VHVRVSSVTRRGKTYQYVQLVESVRRERDGVPVHQVIANLGRISDPVQVENLKAAFAANRSGQRLGPVVATPVESAGETERLRRPVSILRYLDVAVVVEVLRQEPGSESVHSDGSVCDLPGIPAATLFNRRKRRAASDLGAGLRRPLPRTREATAHGSARTLTTDQSGVVARPDDLPAGLKARRGRSGAEDARSRGRECWAPLRYGSARHQPWTGVAHGEGAK
jgi:hypothetical protein